LSRTDSKSGETGGVKSDKGSSDKQKEKDEILGKYRKAAAIAKDVRESIKPLVKVGAPLIELCDKTESLIVEKGGVCAFPCNISINNIAAHYSSPPDDKATIHEKDVVKVDYGVHVDGYIADTAFTVSFDPAYQKLVEAAERGLKVAVDNMKAGADTRRIGALIEVAIREMGYKPIRELSGHLLGQYELHGPKTIPCVGSVGGQKLEDGEVYAVETFATSGSGSIHDTPYCYIYRLVPVRSPIRFRGSRQILSIVQNNYKTLPFAERWIAKQVSKLSLRLALKELTSSGLLFEYHVLSDTKESMIAQSEETVLVKKDSSEVLTH
jgi:methionyl aminopeptidase